MREELIREVEAQISRPSRHTDSERNCGGKRSNHSVSASVFFPVYVGDDARVVAPQLLLYCFE